MVDEVVMVVEKINMAGKRVFSWDYLVSGV